MDSEDNLVYGLVDLLVGGHLVNKRPHKNSVNKSSQTKKNTEEAEPVDKEWSLCTNLHTLSKKTLLVWKMPLGMSVTMKADKFSLNTLFIHWGMQIKAYRAKEISVNPMFCENDNNMNIRQG